MGDIPSLKTWKMVQSCKNITFVIIHFGIQVNNFDKQTVVMSLETVQYGMVQGCGDNKFLSVLSTHHFILKQAER